MPLLPSIRRNHQNYTTRASCGSSRFKSRILRTHSRILFPVAVPPEPALHWVMDEGLARPSPQAWLDDIASSLLQGYSVASISKLTGLPPGDIVRLMTSADFTRSLEKAQREGRTPKVGEMLHAASPLAAAVVTELLITGSERTRKETAFGLLDRTGYEPHSRQDVNFRGVMVGGNLSEDDLREILLTRFRAIREKADE